MVEIEKKGKIKGITLIALIITIIILLILAGVTIGAIGGNSGILTKAEKATAEWNKKAEEEQNAINEINKELAISSPKGNIQIDTKYRNTKWCGSRTNYSKDNIPSKRRGIHI